MKITEHDISHTLRISALSTEDAKKYKGDLENILDFLSAIDSVDVSDVDCINSSIKAKFHSADDVVQHDASAKEIMSNAPSQKLDSFFVVPKVIE